MRTVRMYKAHILDFFHTMSDEQIEHIATTQAMRHFQRNLDPDDVDFSQLFGPGAFFDSLSGSRRQLEVEVARSVTGWDIRATLIIPGFNDSFSN